MTPTLERSSVLFFLEDLEPFLLEVDLFLVALDLTPEVKLEKLLLLLLAEEAPLLDLVFLVVDF